MRGVRFRAASEHGLGDIPEVTTLVPVQPVVYGPTWQRDADGKFVLPEKTLGWDVIDWCHEYLRQPDGPDIG